MTEENRIGRQTFSTTEFDTFSVEEHLHTDGTDV
jgi:hypothetical protein